MKKVIFLFALILGLASATFAQSTEPVVTLTNEFTINIDNTTSRTDLLDLKNELATYGVSFMYNPSFTPEKKLNGIKVRVKNAVGVTFEYALNPMGADDALIIERKSNEDGELKLFVGEK